MIKKKNYAEEISKANVSVSSVKDTLKVIAYMLLDVLGELQRINKRIDEVDNK